MNCRSLLACLFLSVAVGCSGNSGGTGGGAGGGSAGGGAGGGSAGGGSGGGSAGGGAGGASDGGTSATGELGFAPVFARESYYSNFLDAGINGNVLEIELASADLTTACNTFHDVANYLPVGAKLFQLQLQAEGSNPLTTGTYDLSGASSVAYGKPGPDGGFELVAAGTGGSVTLTAFSRQSASGTFDLTMFNVKDGGTSTLSGKFVAPFCTVLD